MFNLFKKKERTLPPFKALEESKIKDQYCVRTTQWDWLDDNAIYVIDNNAPKMITMDLWPQLVYIEADGQKSISELIYGMASQYSREEPIPEGLDATIIEVIESLLHNRIIELSAERKELPYYLALPISEQDKEKAQKLMIDDNFIEKK